MTKANDQTREKWTQSTLYEGMPVSNACTHTNIAPSGDPMIPRKEGDGICRHIFQNIRGTHDNNFEATHEIEAIDELGANIAGYQETNKPWTSANKNEHDMFTEKKFRQIRTVYSSAPTEHGCKYQPGGCLLTINGDLAGAIQEQGSDRMGRYTWFKLTGKRGEGRIIINARRVCQKETDKAGSNIQYMREYSTLRSEGVREPNPQKQILDDLLALIEKSREEGFERVSLTMDANGDYQYARDVDKDMQKFIRDAHLVDPFYDKFKISPRTYLWGK